jgi:hypothetical protein
MTDWCTRKGPKTGGRCSKRWSNEHPEHHSLDTGERWTDAEAEAIRAARAAPAAKLDALLAEYDRGGP